MSSDSFKILTEKKGKQLSKMLRIDSQSISTKLISNMQSRINNPLFKLSIEDYEAMCGNNKMKNMMSKVIGCDVKQLTKFCKYINIFFKNIKSSPKSIKNKIIESKKLMRGSLSVLPDDMLEQIVNKYKTIFKVKYVLKYWIPLNKLNGEILSENPNAIDYLKENRNLIDWAALLRNPNPEAIALFIENKNNIPNYYDLLFNNISSATYNRAITNPAAIEYIKDVLNRYPDNIEWRLLSRNPAAIELIKDKIREEALNPDVVEHINDPFFGALNLQTHYTEIHGFTMHAHNELWYNVAE